MTPRGKRSVDRLMKKQFEGSEQIVCSACLFPMEEDTVGRNVWVVSACGHPIHMACAQEHLARYLERSDLPDIIEANSGPNGNKKILAKAQFMAEKYHWGGAPCPICMLPFPLRHMHDSQAHVDPPTKQTLKDEYALRYGHIME